MGKKENKVEKYLKRKVENLGGICYKFNSPGRNGVPDRLCIMREGITVFVETKAPNGRLSPRQKQEISLLRSLGHAAVVATNYREVDNIISVLERRLNEQRQHI